MRKIVGGGEGARGQRFRLVALLLYGAGLDLQGFLGLRVKDIDFGTGEIRIRRGKGAQDRVSNPESLAGV